MSEAPNPGWLPSLTEFAIACGAAALSGYVKAKQSPRRWSVASMIARTAEAIVCGCLAIAIAGYLETKDPRITVGISAALGLLGTQAISDLLMRLMLRRGGES